MNELKTLRLAILDNTVPKGKANNGYARGEREGRFSGLANCVVNGMKFDIAIIDPFPFPLNSFRGRHSLYAGLDVLRAIKVFLGIRKYDIILSINESSAFALLLLKRIFRYKTPILVLDPALDFSWKPRKVILDFVIPNSQLVLLRGNNQAELIGQVYGRQSGLEVIYHAINTDFYWPQPEAAAGGYVFSIGNDVGRDFSTLIAASMAFGNKVLIKTNEHAILRNDLPNNVEILRERVSFDKLKALYAGARFVVVPLKDLPHAGGVNSVLEAMAMGKALIVSHSRGIQDYIIHNETALVVEPGNVEQLGSAMRYLYDNPEEVERIGGNARRHVVDNHANEIYTKRLARIIIDAYNKADNAESLSRK